MAREQACEAIPVIRKEFILKPSDKPMIVHNC